MKFDFCVGNPPYQEEIAKANTGSNMFTKRNVFDKFQTEMETVSNSTCLIYPALRWMQQSGKGLKEFGYNQINDPHLKALKVFANANDVFNNVGIADGVSIVLKDAQYNSEKFSYIYI